MLLLGIATAFSLYCKPKFGQESYDINNVEVSVKKVINTTNYSLDSMGGKLVTTTCFGHQVTIVRLYTLK